MITAKQLHAEFSAAIAAHPEDPYVHVYGWDDLAPAVQDVWAALALHVLDSYQPVISEWAERVDAIGVRVDEVVARDVIQKDRILELENERATLVGHVAYLRASRNRLEKALRGLGRIA